MGKWYWVNLHRILPWLPLSIFSPDAAFSLDTARCPAEWSPYVAAVEGMGQSGSAPSNVLFADRSGKIHDCLKSGLSPDFIRRAELISKSLPHDRKSRIGADPSQWPLNICRVSETRLDGTVYLTVNLPLDRSVLEMPECFRTVIGSSFLVLPED
jgi:hypothetical protein